MERAKRFILVHFETILVSIILAVAFTGTYYIEETSVVLNFYYLPVLVAAYFLGRRSGLLTASLSILVVLLSALLFPERLFPEGRLLEGWTRLGSWGGFLILASVTVGTLYEIKEQQLRDLKGAYIGVLEILSKYLESSDPYTKGHSVRVAELSCEIAAQMNLPDEQTANIKVAGLLHDIGKIEISGEVLRKAAELSEQEREYVDSHSEKGAQLLCSVGGVLRDVVPIVLAHHKYFVENLQSEEGKNETIPIGARVVAVADAYDAMTSDRPYRRAKPPWEAIEEIVANSGRQFDPRVVEAFKKVVGHRVEVA